MEDILQKIIHFADGAHGEQRRKYTRDRYIVHPIRVMRTCQNYTADISVLAAAILHDVLEDTVVKEVEIRLFLKDLITPEETDKTLQLVADLTDVFTKQAYPKLNRSARKAKELERLATTHPDSQTIKYADILDNSDEVVTNDPDFAIVFLNEYKVILQKLERGDPALHQKAIETVNSALSAIRPAPSNK